MGKLEKTAIILLIIVLVCLNAFIFITLLNLKKDKPVDTKKNIENTEKKVHDVYMDSHTGEYQVYQNDMLIKTYNNYDEAVNYAAGLENASVKRFGGDIWLWDNTPQFNVYLNESDEYTTFPDFASAVKFAKQGTHSDIYFRKNNKFVWSNHSEIKSSMLINNVPFIRQYPELHRGCEVTSLAMLLNFKGNIVSKMTLAQEIKKDNTEYRNENGHIYYGNPNSGFVGDIYSSEKMGLGVYHKPIYDLLKSYIGNEALDITGCEFEDLYFFINKNIPVWIITNTKYTELSSGSFQTWNTPEGKIDITFFEHSVVVTGYDENYIYFNDPMSFKSNDRRLKSDFIKAWKQMGRQAVTYCP